MRNKTKYKTVAFYDGDRDLVELFAELIADSVGNNSLKSIESTRDEYYNNDVSSCMERASVLSR